MVNEALAQKAFPHQNPVGRRLSFHDRMVRVIGVVATVKSRSVAEDPRPCFYIRIRSAKNIFGVTLLIKTKNDPASYANAARGIVRELDPAMAVFDVRTMETHLTDALILPRMGSVMLGMCGFMGLLISSVGLYGVVSFVVARRTREIGIRMALGARRSQVLAMVLKQGCALVVIGCASGLPVALSATDAVTFALTPLFLMTVAVIACLIPARKAAGLDPINTLRYE
jgi:ABC-type antimicrobial peptide transport system permease subunit